MRKAAQKLYLEEQKYWKDNAALIEQQIEEDKQRQIKECVRSCLRFGGPSRMPSLTCGNPSLSPCFAIAQNVFVAGRYDGSQASSHAVDSPPVYPLVL